MGDRQLIPRMHLVVADTIPVLLNFYLPQFSFNREIVTVIVSIVVVIIYAHVPLKV